MLSHHYLSLPPLLSTRHSYMLRRDHHHYLNSLSFSAHPRNLHTIKPLPTFPFLYVFFLSLGCVFLTPSPINPFMSICLLPGFFLYSTRLDSMVCPNFTITHVLLLLFIFNRNSLGIIADSHIFMCMTSSYSSSNNNHFNNSNWCYFGFKWITNFESDDCAIAAINLCF